MGIIPHKQSNVVWRSPFYELERLQREMSRLFDRPYPESGEANTSLLEGFWSPAVDVVDREDAILVRADLPGISREDIDVTIENNVLTIRGEKKQEKEDKSGEYVRSERYYGSFHRAFTLPSSVNPEKVSAKFDKGVLELSIAKKEEAKPRQIKIDVK